jgi:hypothetical protein
MKRRAKVMSGRTSFSRARTESSTRRGSETYSPHSAVSERLQRIFAGPPPYIRSTMSFISCRHSK